MDEAAHDFGRERIPKQNSREDRRFEGCRLLLRRFLFVPRSSDARFCLRLFRSCFICPFISLSRVSVPQLFDILRFPFPHACYFYSAPLLIAELCTLLGSFFRVSFPSFYLHCPVPEFSFPRGHDAIFFPCHRSSEIASTHCRPHPQYTYLL